MSQLLINKYLTELAKLRQVGGTHRESVVREAFKDLLKSWGRSLDLTFIPEYELETKTKERRYVDGALLHTLRVPFGYWEAKDEKDDIDAEIETKFRRGYPKTNIVFEDSTQAVLIQNGEEVMRCGVEDVANLEKLLKLFFGYARPEIEAFRKAVDQFKTDLPAVLDALRSMIDQSLRQGPDFRKAAAAFLKHAQEAINPSLVDADVREMLIQHILTGEVFAAVFPGTTFHEDNSVARELHKLEATFFTGDTKHQTLKGLAPYYTAIRKAATEIANLEAKQYDKILISRIVVTLKTDPKKGIDPTDLKLLVDYFHASLEKAFKPQMQIVTAPGPGVLVMRTALTDLVPTDSTRSLLGTAVPYGFVAEAGSGVAAGRPAGSTPYLGQTGVELQFADGANGAILGECADTQVGRKYAADLDRGAGNAAQTWASGYLGSFQAWTYAKDAFDKWSVQIAQRVAVLRGAGGAPR